MFIHIKDRTTEQTYPNGTRTAQIRAQTAPSTGQDNIHKGQDNRMSQTRAGKQETQYP